MVRVLAVTDEPTLAGDDGALGMKRPAPLVDSEVFLTFGR
jgi:hypothetical protein